jgi:putative ABC transport system ATP-binding protein
MAAALVVRNVTKVFSAGATAVRAVDAVSLDVAAGEMVILTGPSGSGKTTLLCIMGCILHPTSGSVAIFDQDVVGLSERELPRLRRRRIGFVFQTFNLFPTLSAVENVALALQLRGVAASAAHREARALLDPLGLGHVSNALPRDLSAGQQQRVSIARALVGAPDIVLADEPTGSLDSQNGHVVMALLRDAAQVRHRAVVVVSHDSRLFEYADRIVYLDDGRTIEPQKGGCDETLHAQIDDVDRIHRDPVGVCTR